MSSVLPELRRAGDPTGAGTFFDKRNFAQRLSNLLAVRFANDLRSWFPGILPDEKGRYAESRARTSKGFKKLDVNDSTVELGLGLGISKTFNFRDQGSDRHTKNHTARGNELRAEAEDYHERQPFAVLIAVIFLPADSCLDGEHNNWSSFAQAVKVFRWRAGRSGPAGKPTLFERLFIGLYEAEGEKRGEVAFFDVLSPPPRRGRPRPESLLTFARLIEAIRATYDRRNDPPLVCEDKSTA